MGINTGILNYQFPSHLVTPEVKQTKKWLLDFCKAYHSQFRKSGRSNLYNRQQEYSLWRRFARGEQSVDYYKPLIGIKKDQGRNNKSWRNLDFEILKIAPRFSRVVIGKLLNESDNLKIKAIDPLSVDAERQQKAKLQEWMLNKEFLGKIAEMSQIKFDSPVADGEPEPMSQADVDTHMSMFYKDRYSMDLLDAIRWTMSNSDWEQHRQEIITDLVEVGIAGTRTFIDKDGKLKTRRTYPERMGSWGGKREDFRDSEAIWEYIEMTISEFKWRTEGRYTEEEYQAIAEKASGQKFDEYIYAEDEVGYRYPYDDTKINVMDLRFKSVDTWIHLKKTDKNGNVSLSRKSKKWYDPKKKIEGQEVIKTEVQNIYEAMWVVDTDVLFDYGLATDMERPTDNLSRAPLGYTMYNFGDKSLISECIPVFNAIQINWLQYQSHIARSKPGGVEVELSAFENISMGKGAEKMSPKDVLAMYYDTGSIVWRRKDWRGGSSNTWKPLSESKPILPEGALMHLNLITELIDQLRRITGINEVNDGTSPKPNIGKAVSEISAMGSNNALQYLSHAYKSIYLGTVRTIALQIPELVRRGEKQSGMVEALGKNTYKFFELNQDITYRDFGIELEMPFSDEQKIRLSKYIELSIQAGTLTLEDSILIEGEPNPYRAIQMLVVKTKQNKKEAAQAAEAQNQQLMESQQASNQQAADNESEQKQADFEMSMQKDDALSKMRMDEDDQKTANAIMLAKVQSGIDLTEQENDLLNKLIISREKNETDTRKAIIISSAKSAEDTAKMAPTTSADRV